MHIACELVSLRTRAPIEIIDVTAILRAEVERSGIVRGQVTLFSPHTTAFVCLNEHEPMLRQDMLDYLARLVPPQGDYRHNREPVDGRPNAHAHLLGLFMNASETIPIAEGRPLLGAWQSVFFVELDGPREERRLQIQVVGER